MSPHRTDPDTIRLFLAGDVMLGRGIDQILAHPGDPVLFEDFASSALDYVTLAERVNGPIPHPVADDYVWGDLLATLGRWHPDIRLINLETALTVASSAARKGINYRMNPGNAPVLRAAGIDGCVLANNHVLDWGADGLTETLQVLDAAGIGHAGAGRTGVEAAAPLVLPVPGKGRVIVLAFGATSSGIPPEWRAGPDHPGVTLLATPEMTVAAVRSAAGASRQPRDILVFSVHWGGNWGYGIPEPHRALAHALIEAAGVDIVHGHSSHHPLAAEVHHGKLILYGCGDLLNDYEGIGGHEQFRGDLSLAWFADVDAQTGRLHALGMVPFKTRAFRLGLAQGHDAEWLAQTMERECERLGWGLLVAQDGALYLQPRPV